LVADTRRREVPSSSFARLRSARSLMRAGKAMIGTVLVSGG
jgi:hypothetical protein